MIINNKTMLWHSIFYGKISKFLMKDCWPIAFVFADRETTTKWSNLLKKAAKRKTDGSLQSLIPSWCRAAQLCGTWTWTFTAFPGLLFQLHFLRWNYYWAQIFLQYSKTSNLTVAKGTTCLLHCNKMHFLMKHVRSSSAHLQSKCHHFNSSLSGRPCSKGIGILQGLHLAILILLSPTLIKYLNIIVTNICK